jgi:hypothetical protein
MVIYGIVELIICLLISIEIIVNTSQIIKLESPNFNLKIGMKMVKL